MCKRCNIFNAFTQGRYFNRENTETVVQILPESLRLYFLQQIPVGCGNHTHIHLDGLVITDPFELTLL